MTLARHHRPIAAAFWFGLTGGPVWVVVLLVVARRRWANTRGDLHEPDV